MGEFEKMDRDEPMVPWGTELIGRTIVQVDYPAGQAVGVLVLDNGLLILAEHPRLEYPITPQGLKW